VEGSRIEGGAPGLTPAAVRRRFPEAFQPRPGIYWADLTGSAALGWGAFAVAGRAGPHSWLFVAAGAVAMLALYRAVLFIHELAHLPRGRGRVRGLDAAWDLLVGIPLLVPSLVYVESHLDHHRVGTYGTADDPEYLPLGRWHPLRVALASLSIPFVPALLVLRWGVLGPLSWLAPPLRRLVVTHLSTLVINAAYRRRPPQARHRRRWALEELAATLTVWAAAAGVARGAIALHWVALWYAMGAGILLVNHVRTLAAHRYLNEGEPLDRRAELLDSVSLDGSVWLGALVAPVGLRFHALHHLVPGIPYHNLGAVHRALVRERDDASPYELTLERGVTRALARMVRGPHLAFSAGSDVAAAAPGPGLPEGRGGDAAAR
jgi:fatty acid desaturase